ncbi:hypothetical protein [Streptomyces sp. NPDC055607]
MPVESHSEDDSTCEAPLVLTPVELERLYARTSRLPHARENALGETSSTGPVTASPVVRADRSDRIVLTFLAFAGPVRPARTLHNHAGQMPDAAATERPWQHRTTSGRPSPPTAEQRGAR